MAGTAAVFFDVDFTLIRPGPRFQGEGYRDCCARHGVRLDVDRYPAAVRGASGALTSADQLYDADLFINYARRIIELMGGTGPGVDAAAREMYDEWAEHHHFVLYDDVPEAFRQLSAQGRRLGLISNSHRCLASFQSHFDLDGLIDVTVSSSTHGFLKPHPSIFRAALALMDVPAAEAVMVGDSVEHDVQGARRAGMQAVLLARGEMRPRPDAGVPVIRRLTELPAMLGEAPAVETRP